MVTMARTQSDSHPAVDEIPNPKRREGLYRARSFRLEQVAGLERELADAPYESVTRALHQAAIIALADIDAALDRMARGDYGLCVTCGRPIPEERLEVLPMSAQCMTCHSRDGNRLP